MAESGALRGRRDRPPLAFMIVRAAVWALFGLLFRVDVRGRANLPRTGGYIIAANHLSWLDIFMLMVYLPPRPRIHFIAAREEVFHSRVRMYFTTEVGSIIPVDRLAGRVGRDLFTAVAQVIDGGGALAIFPEGDVSDVETGWLKPFKKGLGVFAAQTGAAIVPVAFGGTKELYLGKRVTMTIGAPIAGQKGGKAVADAQTQRTADAISAILRPPAPPPTRGITGWLARRRFLYHTLTHLFTTEEGSLESRLAQKEAGVVEE